MITEFIMAFVDDYLFGDQDEEEDDTDGKDDEQDAPQGD